MTFYVLKSYDGGRSWEPARRCADFASAAQAADTLRSRHPMIRFRVDVEAPPPAGRRPYRSMNHPVAERFRARARRTKSSSARK